MVVSFEDLTFDLMFKVRYLRQRGLIKKKRHRLSKVRELLGVYVTEVNKSTSPHCTVETNTIL